MVRKGIVVFCRLAYLWAVVVSGPTVWEYIDGGMAMGSQNKSLSVYSRYVAPLAVLCDMTGCPGILDSWMSKLAGITVKKKCF